jgi:hypothetical protein
MGHANLGNLSNLFVRQLFAKGKLSIREITDIAVAKKETVHASEGELDDECMLSYSFEEIVGFLLCDHKSSPKSKATPVIEVCDYDKLTDEQRDIYDKFVSNDDAMSNWDSGDDGRSGEYGLLDSIYFRFAPGWRKRYPDIPILDRFEN